MANAVEDPPVRIHGLERRNALILRCAGEGIYGLDHEGKTTFVNPAGAAMLGWTPEELMGRPQHSLIHHSHPDGSAFQPETCPIYAAFNDGEVHEVVDEVFWRKDGSSFPVEYVSTPIHDECGGLEGAVVTFRDVTEQRRVQADLREALAEVGRLKDRLEAENDYLREEIDGGHELDDMIGASAALEEAKQRVRQVAPTDANVLIQGETGVGKERFARAIHNNSARRERPLIKINCAALPSTLIESELFGHEKGAFTGATSRRVGRFELADGGTIFLDEIGELPLELQPKLLRVLQEGEIERVGGGKTIEVDVRVVAATNRDLTQMVWAGKFRDDLYYRLNVFPIGVPPLRDRGGDIPRLVGHFVRKFASKLGRTVDPVAPDVLKTLGAYRWPGNIRELENVVERAVILATGSTLPLEAALDPRPMPPRRESGGRPAMHGEGTLRTLKEVESDHIRGALEHTGWRVEGDEGAATILGMHPNTLRSRMKKLDIHRE